MPCSFCQVLSSSAEQLNMLNKNLFQKSLEEIGMKYFLENSGIIEKRSGNTTANESYFRFVRKEILEKTKCGVLMLGKQECPDSGIFADYGYLNEKDVNWKSVYDGTTVVIKVKGDLGTSKYLTFPSLILKNKEIKEKNFEDFSIDLNKHLKTDEFYGIEYKATKNSAANSVGVASFNSTCPSGDKNIFITGTLIHNLNKHGKEFKPKVYKEKLRETTWKLKLLVVFKIYYFIVNDADEEKKSKIKHIVIVPGEFFGGAITHEQAAKYSVQPDLKKLGYNFTSNRIKLRLRPFFEAPNIKVHNGYGLYVGWKPVNKNKLINDLAQCYTLEELEDMVA